MATNMKRVFKGRKERQPKLIAKSQKFYDIAIRSSCHGNVYLKK